MWDFFLTAYYLFIPPEPIVLDGFDLISQEEWRISLVLQICQHHKKQRELIPCGGPCEKLNIFQKMSSSSMEKKTGKNKKNSVRWLKAFNYGKAKNQGSKHHLVFHTQGCL